MKVDEDLTMEKRRVRWRMVERARIEREKGRNVMVTNRRMWVEGEEWRCDEESENWMVEK